MDVIKKKPIILDSDPNYDDAIALILASAYKDVLDIKAITITGDNKTNGYLKVATLLGLKSIPIAFKKQETIQEDLAKNFDSCDDSYLDTSLLPESKVELCDLSAVELMAKVLKESKEKVTIVATGPQTNIAALLIAHPELVNKIECISIMGGCLNHGDCSATAESNIYADPESAHIVFKSGLPIVMAGLDVTEKAFILEEEWDKIANINNDVAKIVAATCDFSYSHLKESTIQGALLSDPCAIMALVHPEIFESIECYVEVDTQGEYTRGSTTADYRDITGNVPNCKCLINVDRKKYVQYMYEACLSFTKEA